MRRDSNRRQKPVKSFENKMLISGGVVVFIIIGLIICMSMYSESINKNSRQSKIDSEEIGSLVPNSDYEDIIEESESASSSIGKTVEESNSTTNSTNSTNTSNATNNSTYTNNKNTTSNSTKNNNTIKSTSNTSTTTNSQSTIAKEEKKEVSFAKPVEGEVIKEFAKDNLIYSNTLQEWVTHLGIDIKADKTTVVKSAADGTIKSIKNDPRYGLTIVIDHEDGYQTIYSNLLTTEFVVEGEKVTQGQSIGTVGNTAAFEISDESHLHFELLKDSEQLDPSIYIK